VAERRRDLEAQSEKSAACEVKESQRETEEANQPQYESSKQAEEKWQPL